MKQLLEIYRRHREGISYLFWGVVTTVINYAAYFLCTRALGIHYLASDVIAWIVSVVFAYVVNKLFVFRKKDWAARVVAKEFLQFVSGRVASGVLEFIIMAVFIDSLGCPDAIVKIVANVVVVIVNYFFSKFLVFREKKS